MILEETFTLENGVQIPKLALGTWQIDNDQVTTVVESALANGYRHIDTAVEYQNESGVGKGIKASGLDRAQVFVTTKIPSHIKTYAEAKQTIESSLASLQVDYLDLVLIHAPKPWKELFAHSEKNYDQANLAVWKAMEEYHQAGKIRAIGVSNFEIADLQNLIDHAEVQPMVNQVRVHIGHVPTEIIEYCQKHHILVEAFSPNATGKLLHNETVVQMAEKYRVSVPQLSLRFDLQLVVLPLPKTTHQEYLIQNAQLDFEIDQADMEQLLAVPEVDSLG